MCRTCGRVLRQECLARTSYSFVSITFRFTCMYRILTNTGTPQSFPSTSYPLPEIWMLEEPASSSWLPFTKFGSKCLARFVCRNPRKDLLSLQSRGVFFASISKDSQIKVPHDSYLRRPSEVFLCHSPLLKDSLVVLVSWLCRS